MKAIAIDFDGCLCDNEYPEIGTPHWDVITRAKQEQEAGAGLILWTCREGKRLQEAVESCEKWGLRFDAINESLPSWIEAFGNAPRKVGATEYWDDRAVRMLILTPPNEPMLERVVREYLEICGKDCAGDPSVGIPECPFYQYADVMDNGTLISPRCELAAYCRPPEGEV